MRGNGFDDRTLPVYTARLYDGDMMVVPSGDDDQESQSMRAQKEPLLQIHDYDYDTKQSSSSSSSSYNTMKALCFLGGSVLGMIFSIAGFYIQEHFQFEQILWYSLVWSCFTSASAYLAFYFWMMGNSEDSEDERRLEVTEYYFALGVFLGFCGSCTATDVVLGMPWQSIMVTVIVAICWALLMAYCAGSDDSYNSSSSGRRNQKGGGASFFTKRGAWKILNFNKEKTPKEEQEAFLRQRTTGKGTVLPIVFV